MSIQSLIRDEYKPWLDARVNNLIIDGKTTYNNRPFIFVQDKSDFPPPIEGVITLQDNYTYYIITTIDLMGDRLLCGDNTTILGASSENCRIKSTGLSDALITSIYTLPIRFITIEAQHALDLDATLSPHSNNALDWNGVNFTNCEVIGTIKNYSNFIFLNGAFLNSGGLTFNGSIGTIGFDGTIFINNDNGNPLITIPSTCTITRRFRSIYSSFVITGGQIGLDVNISAIIPDESYILDTVNFSGGGTYLIGIDDTSNKSLYVNCVGINNTTVSGQMSLINNLDPTVISATSDFYKILGTSIPSPDNEKFDHSNNRLTCKAIIRRRYLVQCSLSFTSGNNNVCEFSIFNSQTGVVIATSSVKSTANSAGRAENISLFTSIQMGFNDYIEIYAANTSATTNIVVTDMNVLIIEN